MKGRFLFAAIFAVLSSIGLAGPSSADPAALFNQAIADANRISSGLPTTERLAAYEQALESLDRIVTGFPSSEEARILLSGQSVGSFSPNALREFYIDELTGYYDTVCEVSPSYTCLAFVSLRIGSDICETANTIGDLEAAFESLGSALRIFTSQSANQAFGAVTISTARQCGARNLDTWNRDYFSFQLVEMLLLGGQETAARATIENMETPYFRFNGVLALQRASGSIVNQQYIDRLDRFIEDDIAAGLEDNRAPVDAFLATLSLRMFAIENSSITIDFSYLYDSVQKFRNWGDESQCDSQYVSYLFNQILDFQIALNTLPQDRRDITLNREITGRGFGEAKLMEHLSSRPRSVFEACSDGEYYDLTLMARIHGSLLVEKGPEVAMRFRRFLQDRSMTREELVEIYLQLLNPSIDDLIQSYFLEDGGGRYRVPIYYLSPFDLDTGWPIVGPDSRSHGLAFNPATFPVFRLLVDSGDVCHSTRILFYELSGTPRFDEAVRYMIESTSIDPDFRHSCGDEELELLLER